MPFCLLSEEAFLENEEVTEENIKMQVKKFMAGMFGTNMYLLINEATKEAVVVDPAGVSKDMERVIDEEGLTLRAILLTHAHFDHIMGLDHLIRTYGQMLVLLHGYDVAMLEDSRLNMSFYNGVNYFYEGVTTIMDGQVLQLAGITIKVIHTPGHTPGGVCFYIEDEGVLICGDTLFRDSVGRTDFPGGSMSQLVRSIREKLFVLPDDTKCYPGHMGSTTIGHEKQYNPFL